MSSVLGNFWVVGLLSVGLLLTCIVAFGVHQSFPDSTKKYRAKVLNLFFVCLLLLISIFIFSLVYFGLVAFALMPLVGVMKGLQIHFKRLLKERDTYPFTYYLIVRYMLEVEKLIKEYASDPTSPPFWEETEVEELIFEKKLVPALKQIEKDWPSYAFLLRGFSSEQFSSGDLWGVASEDELDFEREIESRYGDALRFVAVGGEIREGAARIRLPGHVEKDAWLVNVKSLIFGADLIIICPALSRGVLTECKLVIKWFSHKAIFHMAGAISASEAKEISAVFRSFGVEIPKRHGAIPSTWRYNDRQEIVKYGTIGEALSSVPVDLREGYSPEYYLSGAERCIHLLEELEGDRVSSGRSS